MNNSKEQVAEQKIQQDTEIIVDDNLHDKRYADPFEDDGAYCDEVED